MANEKVTGDIVPPNLTPGDIQNQKEKFSPHPIVHWQNSWSAYFPDAFTNT